LIPAGTEVTVPPPVPFFVMVRVRGRSNLAVADLSAPIVMVQVVLLPEHAPDQPTKYELEGPSGVAVSVTTAPWSNWAEHVAPQLIPAGLDATVPLPVPVFATVNVRGIRVNVAVVETLPAGIVMVHVVLVPVHAPDHPAKNELTESGLAVSVTCEVWPNCAEHVLPQLIPEGLDETVPVPEPLLVTVRVRGIRLKVAVTDLLLVIERAHEPVPEHAPDQPPNWELLFGDAESVTAVPLS
jgi:hypothetical protein